MTKLEHLKATRKLIERPENWFRVRNGKSSASNKGAHCLVTALGVLFRAETGFFQTSPAYTLLTELAGIKSGELARWNNAHTHSEVLALLDRAIEAAS
jgi:hypothetical protein